MSGWVNVGRRRINKRTVMRGEWNCPFSFSFLKPVRNRKRILSRRIQKKEERGVLLTTNNYFKKNNKRTNDQTTTYISLSLPYTPPPPPSLPPYSLLHFTFLRPLSLLSLPLFPFLRLLLSTTYFYVCL